MSVTLLRTKETVAWEQPASFATSIIVTRLIVLRPPMHPSVGAFYPN